MKAYKLVRIKNDGKLYPLFINKKVSTPIGVWLDAECHPTKGFAVRKGWHCTIMPKAPHIAMRLASGEQRVWCEVEIEDYEFFERPIDLNILNCIDKDTFLAFYIFRSLHIFDWTDPEISKKYDISKVVIPAENYLLLLDYLKSITNHSYKVSFESRARYHDENGEEKIDIFTIDLNDIKEKLKEIYEIFPEIEKREDRITSYEELLSTRASETWRKIQQKDAIKRIKGYWELIPKGESLTDTTKIPVRQNILKSRQEKSLKLKEAYDLLEDKMNLLCIQMDKLRKKHSDILSENINKELADLEMPNAKFSVDIKFNENNHFTENGLNEIEFLISTNIGDEAKSLVKIASGGEISRIMLAIKTVLADSDEVPVLIFDEIDTGISGKAAKSVGEKIKIISKKHQVLCVTHQPSIAAKGDYNYFISKKVKNEKTVTNIKLLEEDEVINEIARIASGDITINSINHAKELRKAV